ncbi:hypothetical protein HOY82DRAFT_538533 [Tuber indicum]|nr:hypothetical protein HOY82DRAFT_538533 [Tuber indicum]
MYTGLARVLTVLYKDTRSLHRDLDYLSIRANNVWQDNAPQLGTVQRPWEAIPGILGERLLDLLYELQYYLQTAYRNLEKTTGKGERAMAWKIKFALFLKRSLQKDVELLEKWRDEFATAFFMISIGESHEPGRVVTTGVGQDPRRVGNAPVG